MQIATQLKLIKISLWDRKNAGRFRYLVTYWTKYFIYLFYCGTIVSFTSFQKITQAVKTILQLCDISYKMWYFTFCVSLCVISITFSPS